ncbi:Ankyrin-2 [Xylographa bjoerkii]|nr:Ankyrin-2 [Xylographa bjoerkii]
MEPISSIATVAGLISTIATLANTLTTLRERYNYAALNVALVASSLWTIKGALEAIAEWRSAAADMTRSSQQLDADLRISLESCALVVAVLERKLAETDLVRPSMLDKIRFVNLDTIYKDFTNHLDGQIRALQLLLTIFQCRTLTEQKEKLSQQESRSIFQQVQNSVMSLQPDDQDIHDAASILSEDPSVHLAVDAILMSHPLYKKVYKNHAPKYYAQVPPLFRAVTRKPLRHTKSKSADYGDRRTKAIPLDPFFAEHAALPFLGIPFHGESSSLFLEDAQAEEEQKDTKSLHELSSKTEMDNNLKPVGQDNNLVHSLITSTKKDIVAKGDSTRDRSSDRGSNEYIAIIVGDDRFIEVPKPAVDVNELPLAGEDSEGPVRSTRQTVGVEAVSPISLALTSFEGSEKSSVAHRPDCKPPPHSPALNDECSTDSHISVIVATDDVGPKANLVYENGDDAVSCQSRHPSSDVAMAPKLQSGNSDDASKVLELPTERGYLQSIRRSAPQDNNLQTLANSDTFNINFGPDLNLNITATHTSPNIDDLVKTDQSSRGSSNTTIPQLKSSDTVEKSDLFEGQEVEDTLLFKSEPRGGEPPRRRPPSVPIFVEPIQLMAGGNRDVVKNENMAGSPVVSLLDDRTRKTQSIVKDASIFSAESGDLRALSSVTSLSSQPGTTPLGFDRPVLVNKRIRSELSQLQHEHTDAKRKGDAQGAKNAIQKSVTIIQKTYFPNLPFLDSSINIQPAPKASRRLSSIARLSIAPIGQHAEKCRAIQAAAATGDFQQLIQLLEQSPKLADAHAPHTDFHGNTQSRTPLMSAAFGGQIPCMELLWCYNVSVAAAGRNGRTALHLAVEAAQLSAVTWLLESGIALTTARNENHELKLINVADTSGSTALHIAASMGQIEIAEYLLFMDAKLDATDNSGRTPLHCAVTNSKDTMVSTLIARGSDINALDETKTTPLMWATMVSSVKCVSHLSENGADITRRDSKGESVFHHAARLGNLAVIDMLYTRLEDLEVRNTIGETPLHLACARDHSAVVVALLQAGVQVNPWTMPVQSKPGFLLKAVAKSLLTESKGVGLLQSSTPLHYTCFLGHYYSAVLLVKHGAWVNAALEDSMTPLMLAVESQNVRLATLLLDNGANVNAATAKACLTPLHLSCRTGNLEMTQLLVGRKANTKALTIGVPPDTPASYGAKIGIGSQAAVNYVLSISSGRPPLGVASNAMYGQNIVAKSPIPSRNSFNSQEYRQYFDPPAPSRYVAGPSPPLPSGGQNVGSQRLSPDKSQHLQR